MKINCIKHIFLNFLAILIIFSPSQKINALSPNWISVPNSPDGEQLWDKNSVQKSPDGSIRVFSKFIPKSTNEISNDILYTMDINCSENSFRDVAVGLNTFDEFTNKSLEWQQPNNDMLILGLIDQVCTFSY